jgi:hypothetical protein
MAQSVYWSHWVSSSHTICYAHLHILLLCTHYSTLLCTVCIILLSHISVMLLWTLHNCSLVWLFLFFTLSPCSVYMLCMQLCCSVDERAILRLCLMQLREHTCIHTKEYVCICMRMIIHTCLLYAICVQIRKA